jgi:RNA polymerase sigma-70 factor (ECF subfamily)
MLSLYLSMLEDDEDKQIFSDIYYETRLACYHMAFSVTNNHEKAEDAVHNAFLAVIHQKEKIFALPRRKRKSYIVIMVKNKAIDLMRSKHERSKVELDETIPDNLDLSESISKDEDYNNLLAAIKKLPEASRVAFEYKYVHDLSNQEIADILGISSKTVSKRIERAKEKLRQILNEEDVYDRPTT